MQIKKYIASIFIVLNYMVKAASTMLSKIQIPIAINNDASINKQSITLVVTKQKGCFSAMKTKAEIISYIKHQLENIFNIDIKSYIIDLSLNQQFDCVFDNEQVPDPNDMNIYLLSTQLNNKKKCFLVATSNTQRLSEFSNNLLLNSEMINQIQNKKKKTSQEEKEISQAIDKIESNIKRYLKH